MLPRDKRLTKKRDFLKMGLVGRPIYGVYTTLRIRSLQKPETKVAFLTSTKMFKLAVDRNRVKRRLREILRDIWNELPSSMHLLFIAKPEALHGDFLKIKEDIRHMLTKVSDALQKPARPSPRARKNAVKKR
ncbi:ribonuclease P protein component [Candidatus Uhrbacteria bacterium]|nr:ribonuclease P protein component [Candidatus Uhrbacteria bacterium]